MNCCPYCKSEVASFTFSHLHLRICPKCFSTFFPTNETMAFRSDLTDKSRELWLNALLKKDLAEPSAEILANLCCIDHGEPMVEGNIPDYGFPGKVTTCCGMFHLTPTMTVRLLMRTLEHPFQSPKKEGKHHFFFIRWLDALVNKIFGEKMPDEDPLDLLQYNVHLKPVLESDTQNG